MSFRNEEKLRIVPSKIFHLREWIKKNLGNNVFPSRIVNSVYFDNQNFSMYHDSMEGVLPRKKIRLRNYDKEFLFNKNINKEIKISSVEGKYKTSEKTKNSLEYMSTGIYDQNYGLCLPVLNVSYKRSYYLVKNIRLTLDEKITYKRIIGNKISNFSTLDNCSIVELKFNSKKLTDFVNQNFPFERARFSKYCRGIEFIRVNYCNEL